MNDALAPYAIQNPRPGVYWVVQSSTGYVKYERSSREAAETKVAELLAEDAAR